MPTFRHLLPIPLIAMLVALSPATQAAADWPTYHLDQSRTGNDASEAFTGSLNSAWTASVDGDVYAEPLLVGSTVLIATENNTIYAFDQASGNQLWSKNLMPSVPNTNPPLPCGNIDPVGITSTPVVDIAANILYTVGLTWTAPTSSTVHYELYALNLAANGAVLWHEPIAPTAQAAGLPALDATVTGQRGALSLNNGMVYVPFGGRAGDCGNYRGWVVAASTVGPSGPAPSAWEVPSVTRGGAVWAPSGAAIDGAGNLYVSTGNTDCSGSCTYDDSEGVLMLSPSLSLLDWFTPPEWQTLNDFDIDLGSVGPSLLPNNLAFQVGKEGLGYLLHTSNLGGAGHQTAAFSARVCTQSSDASFGGNAYDSGMLFVPCVDRLEALSVDTSAPSFTSLWHGPAVSYAGPPIVAGGIVWTIDPSGTLYGLDELSGRVIVNQSIGGADHFATPAAGGGRLFVGAGSQVQAYSLVPNPWHQWDSLGGPITSGPDVASWASNRLDIFARGADKTLWHRWWDGSQWLGWESLGGTLVGAPGAVSWGPNRIDVFSRGVDNALWHKWWDGTQWRGWESLGGTITSGPDVASWASGRLDVFARGSNNTLMHKWWDGTQWRGWESLGGVLGGRPGVISWGTDRIDVFVRGTDSHLWHRWYTASAWQQWENLNGILLYGPDVSSWGANRLDVFGTGGDRALWHIWYDGGAAWMPWESLGGQLGDNPGAASWAAGRIDVFGEGTDGNLWHRYYQ